MWLGRYGGRWSKIARSLPGRAEAGCRARWAILSANKTGVYVPPPQVTTAHYFTAAPRLALLLVDCTSDTLRTFCCTAGAETDEAGKIAGSVAAAAGATAADVLPGAGLAPYPGGGGPCEGGGRAGVAEQATECASKTPVDPPTVFSAATVENGREGGGPDR